jgi:hypothetical protein
MIGPEMVYSSRSMIEALMGPNSGMQRLLPLSFQAGERILGISRSTVRAHLESIFRKLEGSTRAAAAPKTVTLRLI